MKEKLIEILESLGYPAYLQGSMLQDDKYPESFFTFWNFNTEEIRHYNNNSTFTLYGFWVYFYSVNPALVESVTKEAIKKIKNNGFLIATSGVDIKSGIETHTGKMIEINYTEEINNGN